MTRPIEIRLATAEDVASLPVIEEAACSLFDAIPFTAALPLHLTSVEDFEEGRRQGLLWVAEAASGDLVDFALGERLDGALHLEELDVLPGHGRQGIGTRLVRALCEGARDQGLAAVTLCTFRDIPWNAPFYASSNHRNPRTHGSAYLGPWYCSAHMASGGPPTAPSDLHHSPLPK